MTVKQKLIIFLIACDPGVKDIYSLVKFFDRADFENNSITENLKPLLDKGLIFISKNFENGTPFAYEITHRGKEYLDQNFDDNEIIEYIKGMAEPGILLELTTIYINYKNTTSQ
jgi:DNA-binding PadR family transcriptional regulator